MFKKKRNSVKPPSNPPKSEHDQIQISLNHYLFSGFNLLGPPCGCPLCIDICLLPGFPDILLAGTRKNQEQRFKKSALKLHRFKDSFSSSEKPQEKNATRTLAFSTSSCSWSPQNTAQCYLLLVPTMFNKPGCLISSKHTIFKIKICKPLHFQSLKITSNNVHVSLK